MSEPVLTISVVICTRDRREQLATCLAAVAGAGASEILVVDNAPRVASADVAAYYGARYICEPRPGLSRARNRGAAEATGAIVAYLDDDALPQAGWLAALAREFRDPRVGIVFGRALPAASESQLLDLYYLAGFWDPGEERQSIDQEAADWFERASFTPIGIGANMAVRRSAFRTWPGFDERIGCGTPLAGGEEMRAVATLVSLGFRAIYAPGAVVSHPVPPKSAAQLQRRCLQSVHAAGGYLALLLAEEPAHRRAVCRYILHKLRHGYAWRREGAGTSTVHFSRWRTLLARAHGGITYIRMRCASDGRPLSYRNSTKLDCQPAGLDRP